MAKTSQREVRFTFPLCYKPFFDPRNHQILLTSGRDAGKTVNSTQDGMALILMNPRHDAFVFRAKENSIRDADHAEVVKIINSNPVFGRIFEVQVKPLRIARRDGLGTIYFKGADSIGDDGIRNKGLTSQWPLLFVMISECQEFRTRKAVDNLLATVRRSFTESDGGMHGDWRIFVTMNPPQSPFHWINGWQEELERDPDWLVIKTSYKDIVMFLNDTDLKEIRKMRKLDYQRYLQLYMGVVSGGEGDIYTMLNGRAIVPEDYVEANRDGIFPVAVVCGVDGAVENDCTVISPCIIMSDGTMVVSQRDTFRHDPKVSGVIPSYSLCCEGGPIYKWFYGYFDRFGEFQKGFVSKYPGLPKYFFVDDAASELRRYLEVHISKYATVSKVHKSTIVAMVDTVRDAFYQGYVKFAKSMRYTDYGGSVVQERKSDFVAYAQFRSLSWDRTRLKYDDTKPNDDSDSVTYAIWAYYKNPEKMLFPAMMRK